MRKEGSRVEGSLGPGAAAAGPAGAVGVPGKQTLVQRSEANAGAAPVQRLAKTPIGDTEQMHADIYGDSSLAHAPTGGGGAAAPAYKDTVSYLTGAPFDWAKYKGTQPTVAILAEWLDSFSFHEPRPLDYDHDDRCQFNGSTEYFTANVASVFTADARGAAALTYGWAAVKAQIDARLAPMRAARLEQEKAINTGKAPGPGN